MLTREDAFKYPNAPIKFSLGKAEYIVRNWIPHSEKIELCIDELHSVLEHYKDCKLILRKLDSLTEEEKEVLKKLIDSCGNERLIMAVTDWGLHHAIQTEYSYYKGLPHQVADYLRSKRIDIDNMVEQNKAVYENN